MHRKSSRMRTLAVAVATPNLLTNALASEKAVDLSRPYAESNRAGEADLSIVAQNKKRTLTKEEARRQVSAELAKMTAREKARLGRSQVEIDQIVVETANISTCCFTPTNGVTCTDPATGGFACCIVTLAPPPK